MGCVFVFPALTGWSGRMMSLWLISPTVIKKLSPPSRALAKTER
jgi:hypothetical protein